MGSAGLSLFDCARNMITELFFSIRRGEAQRFGAWQPQRFFASAGLPPFPALLAQNNNRFRCRSASTR